MVRSLNPNTSMYFDGNSAGFAGSAILMTAGWTVTSSLTTTIPHTPVEWYLKTRYKNLIKIKLVM